MRLRVAPLPRSPVPREFLDQAETLTSALETLAARFPDYECLTTLSWDGTETRMSIGALWAHASSMMATLRDHGIKERDFVIVILPTGPELLAAYFGVMLAGAIPALVATPANRLAEPEVYARRVNTILESAEAVALITEPKVAAIFRGEHGARIEMDASAGRGPLGGVVLLTDRCRAASPPSPPVRARPDDIATVQYSSGSTGIPKGMLLPHRAMLNNMRAVRDGLGLSRGRRERELDPALSRHGADRRVPAARC